MSKPPYVHFLNGDIESLRALINVLLPLEGAEDATNYAEKLGIVEFLDDLLTESVRDGDLADRFERVAVNPVAQCPIPGVTQWRERRSLDAKAIFDIVRSENVLLESDIKPLVRSEFYAEHLPPLRLAIAGWSDGWKPLVDVLLLDDPERKTDWPHATLKKPSEFLYQLTRDSLHAVLGLRNPYADGGTLGDVLDRLGEKRRVGNSFTPEDSQRAVRHFAELLSPPPAQPAPAPAADVELGPVGSPPV